MDVIWWNIMAGHRSVDACTCAKGFKLKPSDSEIWGGHPLVKKQDLLGDLHTNRNESGAEQQTNQHHVYQSHRFYLWRGVKWLHRFHITFLLAYIYLVNPCATPELTASFISCDASSGMKIQTTKQGAGCCKTIPHMGATSRKNSFSFEGHYIYKYTYKKQGVQKVFVPQKGTKKTRVFRKFFGDSEWMASPHTPKDHLPKPTEWMHSAYYTLQKIKMEPKHGGLEDNFQFNWVIFRFFMVFPGLNHL